MRLIVYILIGFTLSGCAAKKHERTELRIQQLVADSLKAIRIDLHNSNVVKDSTHVRSRIKAPSVTIDPDGTIHATGGAELDLEASRLKDSASTLSASKLEAGRSMVTVTDADLSGEASSDPVTKGPAFYLVRAVTVLFFLFIIYTVVRFFANRR